MARSRQLSESSVDSETIEPAPVVAKPAKVRYSSKRKQSPISAHSDHFLAQKKAKTTSTTAKTKAAATGKGKGKKVIQQPEIDEDEGEGEGEDVEMQEEEEVEPMPVKKGKKKVVNKLIELETADEVTKPSTANEKRLQRKLDTVSPLPTCRKLNIHAHENESRSLSPFRNKRPPLLNSKNYARRKRKNQRKLSPKLPLNDK